MRSRSKIAIVPGTVKEELNSILRFDALNNDFDVQMHLLETSQFEQNISELSSKTFLYPTLPDMPGYLRGLEDYCHGIDLIAAHESTALASFQSVRIARRLNLPIVVFVDEFRPMYYHKFQNIRAIQTDVMTHTHLFIASSEMAKSALRLEMVPEEKCLVLPPPIQAAQFKWSDERRRKFRTYLGLAETDFLACIFKPLHESSRISEVFLALKMLRQQRPASFSSFKLLIVGTGEEAEGRRIKLEAHDHGLGRNVLFLQQNSRPFIKDLYAALDVMVDLKDAAPDSHESYPFKVFEAAASGADVLCSSSTPAAERLSSMGYNHYVLSSDDYSELSRRLSQLMDGFQVNHQNRLHRSEKMGDLFAQDLEKFSRLLKATLDAICEDKKIVERREHVSEQDLAIKRIHEFVKSKDDASARVCIEEALLLNLSAHQKSEVLCFKGEAELKEGHLEAALEHLTESVQHDAANARAFRALGYLSLQSHSHEEAVSFFKRALSQVPSDGRALMGVGLVYRRLGLSDESINWFEQALTQSPDDERALSSFVQACLDSNQTRIALAAIERMVDLLGETEVLKNVRSRLVDRNSAA